MLLVLFVFDWSKPVPMFGSVIVWTSQSFNKRSFGLKSEKILGFWKKLSANREETYQKPGSISGSVPDQPR
jgi:hypothetical protein